MLKGQLIMSQILIISLGIFTFLMVSTLVLDALLYQDEQEL